MIKVVKFIYVMIIILSLFQLSINAREKVNCLDDADCLEVSCLNGSNAECVGNSCVCVFVFYRENFDEQFRR
ncbi:putative Late nodulin [Medicago truncatula]|uniref:Nodule Cysteine-Rich (NCR) secreted peptide n=1 Tax=Medicago truncatula TaxID=3880 RepID=G7IX56_MEDTR|nr:Nodule Cysteine-Rich (NCR) secreted peptide [Medicago truncatula]RHN66367.1 putative Late nodulin [Medicago truncatula]